MDNAYARKASVGQTAVSHCVQTTAITGAVVWKRNASVMKAIRVKTAVKSFAPMIVTTVAGASMGPVIVKQGSLGRTAESWSVLTIATITATVRMGYASAMKDSQEMTVANAVVPKTATNVAVVSMDSVCAMKVSQALTVET